jgi:hypothetical protein
MTVTEDRGSRRRADHVPSRLLGAAVLAGVLLLILIVAAVRGHTLAGERSRSRSSQRRGSAIASPRTKTTGG